MADKVFDSSPVLMPVAGSRKALTLGGLLLFIFVVLALWGGIPLDDRLVPFILSLLILVAVTFVFGFAGWHLLVRPLSSGLKASSQADPLNVPQRRLFALLLTIASICLTMGGLWDEIWHRQYGIPFGEDFFWRPHLMIYAGMLITIVLAMFGWWKILRDGKGTLQQRFRANPLLGGMVLVGTFLIYAVPTDPIWHSLLRGDLSAWSIPHILFAITFILIALSGAAFHLSVYAPLRWDSLLRLRLPDLIPLSAAIFSFTSLILLLTSEWDSITQASVASRDGIVFTRPEWLFPALVTFCAVFVSIYINHALRKFGAATLALGLSLLIRLAMLGIYQPQGITPNAWWLCLPTAIVIDLWYAFHVLRNQRPPALLSTSIVIAVAFAVFSLPLMNQLYLYPQASLINGLPMLLASFVGAWVAGWLAQTIGDYSAGQAQAAQEAQPSILAAAWLSPAVFLIGIAFIAWFMITATPPVL